MTVPAPSKHWQGAAATVVAASVALLASIGEDVVQHDGTTRQDPARLHWFVAHRSDVLVAGSRSVTQLGSAPVLITLALLTSVWLWRRGQELVLAVVPIVALGTAAVLTYLTKAIIGRPRPPVRLHLVTENEPSFPSGHTTDATALLLSVALLVALTVLRSNRTRMAVLTAAAALAGAVGTSRLFLGVHWPSDIVAGWALGTTVALLSVIAAVRLSAHPRRSALHAVRSPNTGRLDREPAQSTDGPSGSCDEPPRQQGEPHIACSPDGR